MKTKIFDCFTFFNEIELLELRFMELYDVVDYFVLSEANKTHSGKSKEFIFEQFKENFKPYLDKVIYVKVEDLPTPTPDNRWIAENFQRNAILRGLENKISIGDLWMVSDLDEIPNSIMIKNYLEKSDKKRAVLKQLFYYYYVNCKVSRNWGGTAIEYYDGIRKPQNLRNSSKRRSFGSFPKTLPDTPSINDIGGWHYSYLYGNSPNNLLYKTQSIVDHDVYGIDNIETVINNVRNLTDIYGRNDRYHQLNLSDINYTKPKSLDKWLKKYPQFFYKENKE